MGLAQETAAKTAPAFESAEDNEMDTMPMPDTTAAAPEPTAVADVKSSAVTTPRKAAKFVMALSEQKDAFPRRHLEGRANQREPSPPRPCEGNIGQGKDGCGHAQFSVSSAASRPISAAPAPASVTYCASISCAFPNRSKNGKAIFVSSSG